MTQAALRSHWGGADHEARLARAAAAGDGRAFATLYDRYEQRVFNLAFRITGSPDHAAQSTREAFLDALHALPHMKGGEPAFGSCLFTATRNASRDLLAQLPGARAVPEPPSVPADDGPPEESDRDLAFEAELREANLRLAEPEREVLALGSVDTLSYGEVAAIMDADRSSLPTLTARALISLHDELSGTSLAHTTASSDECEQALPLIAMRDDGQLEDDEDFQWLIDHLAHCAGCRLRLDAMQRARAAYDAWEPVPAPPAVFREAMAAVAQSTNSDWRDVMDERGAKRSAGWVPGGFGVRRGVGRRVGAQPGKGGWAGLGPKVTAASSAATDAAGSLRAAASTRASDAWRRRPQRNRLVTAGLLSLVLLGLSGIAAGATLVLKSNDRSEPTVPSAAEAAPPAEAAPAPVERREWEPQVTRAAKPKKVKSTPQNIVVIRARPVPEKPPSRPKPRPTPQAEAVPLPKPTPSPPTSQPAPTRPPVAAPPQPQPTQCRDATGKSVPCPG